MRKLLAPAWAILEYGWYPLMVFITTPYFLHTLGAEGFGYWMLLTATVGFGSFLNVGTGAATIKQVSASYGRADEESVGKVVRASLAIALMGGGILAAIIVLVFGAAGNALFAKMGDQSLVLLTGSIAALLAVIEQIDNVFASALKGAEHFGRAARIEMVSKTAQILAAVLAVFLWGGVAALYAALVLVAVVRLVAKSWLVTRLLGVSSLRPSFANLPDTLNYAKWGWIQGVGGLFFGIADRMLVGSFMGAASLAHYSVATQLAQQIHALSAAGLSVIFPKVSRKLEGDANFSLSRITKLMMAGNFLASSILALGLLIFGRKILTLWLGEAEAEASTGVLLYLTVAYWLLAINVVPHFILLGVGKIRIVAISNLAAGLVSLFVMYMLIQHYGLVGVGIARIAYGAITLVTLVSLFEYIWVRNRTGVISQG
jgi:O-antigen/teichoic acid export membrane protein